MGSIRLLLLLSFAAALAGCASTSPDAAQRDVARVVAERTGGRVVHWRGEGANEDAEVDRAVDRLLKNELSPDAAVQIALLSNRHLQAVYEDLGIAQADVVQAGLLKNPVFSASTRTERLDPLPMQSFGVTQDFLSLLTLPARKKIANRQLEATKWRVADAVLATARDVRVAYYRVQAAEQALAMRRTVLDTADAASDLAQRQSEAGNLSDLDAAGQLALAEDARLDVSRAENEALDAREELTRLLGLWGAHATALRVPARLADLPAADPPLANLESLAVGRRLDLEAAREEASAIERALSMTKGFRYTGGIDVGATVDRHSDGKFDVEPNASLEVPLFDQRQAAVAKLEAELKKAQARVAEIAIDARSEVRVTRARLVAARAVAERYQKVLVPLREKIVTLTQQHYDAMLIGVYQLLQAKQAEIAAYGQYIDAVRAYWIARADLDRAVGGEVRR